jgi:threonine/homoserine/homoserine lactone efflux protein
MDIDVWLAFAAASAVLLAIPGPTVTLVVSYGLSQGRASGLSTVPGVALGDFVAMTASLAGAGAILAASATLFTALKLAGAAYLAWLGVTLWRAPVQAPAATGVAAPRSARTLFLRAFAVTALNPKGIVFFIAFVPQFVVADAPLLPQLAIMEATFVGFAAVNAALWAVFAGTLRTRIARPAVLRFLNRLGAGFLIGAGVVTAVARR